VPLLLMLWVLDALMKEYDGFFITLNRKSKVMTKIKRVAAFSYVAQNQG
jgi:hypothetical protein